MTTSAPEFLRDLALYGSTVLTGAGLDRRDAHALAWKIVEQVRANYGGQMTYIPKGVILDISARDLKIWKAFTGQNQDQLAREFELSVQQIYAILRRTGAAQRALRQSPLFDGDE
ncbi:Mor transcription activator family protein [Endothiovibrio diazotrophicus]